MKRQLPVTERRAWPAAVALAAAAVSALLLLAPRTTLWDRDESRFARSAVEMLSSGDSLGPTFAGELRPHKPPLLPWLMALSASVLGPTQTAFRLWSALAHGASVLLTFFAGRRLSGEKTALLGAAFLALSPLALLEGAAATADAVLLAGLTGVLAVFADAAIGGVRARHFVLGALASAIAQLAKGPVALALPLLGLGGALLFAPGAFRERRRLAGLLATSSALGLLPVLAWGLLADAATNGRLLAAAIGTHVIGRALAPMEGHGSGLLAGPLYYGVVLLAGFSPFTLFLPSAWARVRSGSVSASGARAILLGSSLAPFLLFAVVATKLPHYLLPAFPALALLAGDAAESGERRGLVAGGVLLAPVVTALLAALGFLVAAPPLAALRAPAAVAFVAISAETVLAAAFLRSGRSRLAAAALLAGTAAALAATVGLGLPALEAWKPVPRLAADARRVVGKAPAATFGFEEPSVFVYFGPGPVERLANEADAARWARREGPGLLVTTRGGLERLVAREGILPLVPVAWRSGINVSKGAPVELVALARGGPWTKPPR
jgi:4-amino-4-deoxy-L-arabinose transferase-like glycosyltransferase